MVNLRRFSAFSARREKGKKAGPAAKPASRPSATPPTAAKATSLQRRASATIIESYVRGFLARKIRKHPPAKDQVQVQKKVKKAQPKVQAPPADPTGMRAFSAQVHKSLDDWKRCTTEAVRPLLVVVIGSAVCCFECVGQG